MTGEALSFGHRLMAADDGRFIFTAHHRTFHGLLCIVFLLKIMAVQTDFIGGLCQEYFLITGVGGVAADALLVKERFVYAARAAHGFVVTVQTECIGRSLGVYCLFGDGMA